MVSLSRIEIINIERERDGRKGRDGYADCSFFPSLLYRKIEERKDLFFFIVFFRYENGGVCTVLIFLFYFFYSVFVFCFLGGDF